MGLKQDHDGGTPVIGLAPFRSERKPEFPSLLCEDTMRGQPSTNQEEGSHQALNLPAP